MRMGTTALVAFPLSHTSNVRYITFSMSIRKIRKIRVQKKRKVTLQSCISAEPHVASNVRYITFQ